MPERLLEQRVMVERYLKESPGRLSAFSFANIFVWQDFFRFDFKVIRGSLCVFAQNSIGCFLYLPPLGRNVTPEAVGECFRIMEGVNRGSGVTRIENVNAEQLPLFPGGEFRHFRKAYDYCYYKNDIVSLRGNPYKSKRSSCNQFVNNYAHRYVPYEEGMADECLALYRLWACARESACRDDVYRQMLRENAKVHERVLRYCRRLGLTGRVVTVDGNIKAYTFGFSVGGDMFCVLSEIADPGIKGLAVYIFREFCRDPALRPYRFVNAMDDFGMDNIRRTKLSFRPCALLPSYVVAKKVESRERGIAAQ